MSITFTVDSPGSFGRPELLTQGVSNLDFTDAGTGTCTTNGTGYIYSAGNTCTVDVVFTPRVAGPRYGAVILPNSFGVPLATAYIQGTGSGPQVSFLPATQSTLPINSLVSPSRIAVDGAGNLYILQTVTGYSSSNALVKETWTGNGYTQSIIASGFAYPVGLAIDGAGNIFIADQDGPYVVKETPYNGGYAQSIAFSGLGNVEAVAVDGNGNIYIGSLAYGLVRETPATSGYTQSTVARTRYAFAIATDASGNVYVSTNGTAASGFQLFEESLANGVYTENPIGPTAGASLALDGAGNLYTSQPFGNSIYKETLLRDGTYAQSTLTTLGSNVAGMTVDGVGNVYAIASSSVYKFDYADPPSLVFAPTAVGSTSSDSPKTITLVNSGNTTLNFPIPSTGTNPAITANFTLNSTGGSACPLVSPGSFSQGTLVAGASCILPISYTPTATTPLSGFLTLTDTAGNAVAPGYAAQQITLGVTGAQTTPSIDWPAPNAIVYGTPLSGTQLNASSSVPGTFAYSPASGTVLGVGTTPLSVTLTPTNQVQYTTATAATSITVTPAKPQIAWPTIAAITYGTPLGSTQLDATSTVPGTLTYTPAAGTILSAGPHTLSVTLTPSDTVDYTTATLTTTITVTPATPVISWPNPQAITYGTALSAVQLNASAPTPGTFTYSPVSGTIFAAGNQTLTVSFTPTDTTNYRSATGQNSIAVIRVPLTVTAANATRIFGSANPAFSASYVGAVNNDTFTASASSFALPANPVGPYFITPSISGTNIANYNVTLVNGTLTVTPAPLTVVPANVSRAYGAANPSLSGSVTGALSGNTFTVTGSTTATTTSPVGSYPITYTVSGTNLANYTVTQATGTLSITPATPTVTWPTPAPITYGTAISAAQLNATASTPGTFSYSPASGIVPAAGTQTLGVTFTPTDTTNFAPPASTTVLLAVNKAPLSVTANSVARVFGAVNPAFSGAITGAVNGDSFTESFSTIATPASIVGSYPIVPSVAGANLTNYAVTPTNGALTISQAGTTTTFALSNSNLTLTANVASLTSGTPTGSVGFYEGQTLIGTGTLANGTASYTAATFPLGNVVVSAQYSGDANFTQSASPPILVLSMTPAQSTLTVSESGSASDQITLAAASGFTGTLQLSCTNLPQNAMCSFQPATVTFNGTGNSATATLSVQTGVRASATPPSLFRTRPGLAALAGIFWLPALFLVGFAQRSGKLRPRTFLLSLVLASLCSLVTACGSSAPITPAGTSTIQVVATGPSGFTQNTSVTLAVQ